MFPLPRGVQTLLWINVIVFGVDYLLQGRLSQDLALWSIGSSQYGAPGFMPWQLITYSFLHGGVWHLFWNMLGLMMFGADVERVWGRDRFLTYYFVCVVSAALCQLLLAAATHSFYPTIGASGGVFGVLLAFALIYPNATIVPLFPPIPMPARVAVVIFAVLELVQGAMSVGGPVAHFGHLGGMLGGWLLLQYRRKGRR